MDKCLVCGCDISEEEGDNMVANICIGCDIDSGIADQDTGYAGNTHEDSLTDFGDDY